MTPCPDSNVFTTTKNVSHKTSFSIIWLTFRPLKFLKYALHFYKRIFVLQDLL